MRRWISLFVAVMAFAGCSSPGAPGQPVASGGAGQAPTPPSRTLVITGSRAPETLASKPVREARGSGWPRAAVRAMNAGLVLHDGRELPRPYLAENLPQLNTESWRLLADGRMETRYTLRPNLTWHDGTALTAEDVVFAWQVYRTPELGLAASPPMVYIEQVSAPDPRTVVVSWNRPYAQANDLQATDLPPLPRHLLEVAFQSSDADGFAAHPFWLGDYVGAGPYRLARYETGAFLEAEAFGGHALGRPGIDRIRMQFTNDPNTALAQILSDAAHMTTTDTIDLEQAIVLERDWVARGDGTVLRSPVGVRHSNFQLRPEYARPRAQLDLRVRKAIAHGTDREALAQTLTEGQGTYADSLVLPQVEYYNDLERAIARYPYDPRTMEQLLRDAGFTRGGDGTFAHPEEGRLSIEVAVAAGARNDQEVAIMADGLRRVGIDASIRVIPRAQINDRELRSTLPAILNGSHGRAFEPPTQRFRAADIPTASNRWQGSNQTGWTHPEMERLITAYETTLDRDGRNRHIIAMMQLASQELPIIPLYYNLSFLAHVKELRGPNVYASDDVAHWNLHEWRWES